MENYKELKVDIRRFNNVVTCEILEMDERLRGQYMLYREDDFAIMSGEGIGLAEGSLFLRGSNKNRDNNAAGIELKTAAAAIDYIEKIKHHIARFNAICKAILTETELKYLQKFTDLFPVKIISIQKCGLVFNGEAFEYINIWLEELEAFSDEVMSLPCFKAGTMYKNMEKNKKYTLAKLGLTQDNSIKI